MRPARSKLTNFPSFSFSFVRLGFVSFCFIEICCCCSDELSVSAWSSPQRLLKLNAHRQMCQKSILWQPALTCCTAGGRRNSFLSNSITVFPTSLSLSPWFFCMTFTTKKNVYIYIFTRIFLQNSPLYLAFISFVAIQSSGTIQYKKR